MPLYLVILDSLSPFNFALARLGFQIVAITRYIIDLCLSGKQCSKLWYLGEFRSQFYNIIYMYKIHIDFFLRKVKRLKTTKKKKVIS